MLVAAEFIRFFGTQFMVAM
uniref:Uncharacterized protein n=1 Tax=Anguilla anguilla TaxID=7936 RepID=A0A0E9ULZ7_ANGAN